MRARDADAEGFAECGGVKIHYEVHGTGEPALLLMPSWTIVTKRFWKGQLPYLARHHRVVTYDGPGNGRSGRPLEPAAYTQEAQVGYALKVLDAAGIDRAVTVGLSRAANWALDLAANHPHRVAGTVLIGPSVALAGGETARAGYVDFDAELPPMEPSRVPLLGSDPVKHWAKYNRGYWLEHYEDFLWFFMGQCFPEAHSTKQIEDAVGWGLETSGAVLAAEARADGPDAKTLTGWCARVTVFVGNPDDVVDTRFGPDLPRIRDWTRDHYDFAGYVTGFDPTAVADRAGLRVDLGYRPDEQVCLVTVGGSGVGGHLLRRIVAAFDQAARRVPGLRMVVVTGPRIDPATVQPTTGLDVRAFVPDLYRHLAACDLAIVQGGLSTCMELTAAGRPFLFIPLRHHFEQQYHVAHRLARYRAGRRLDYADLTPEVLADAIANEIGRPTAYRPVETDGAARTAALLADLL